MTISTVDASYVPQLRALWKTVFGDTDEFLDLFFESAFRPENTVVALENDRVLSVLYLLPVTFYAGKLSFPAHYIYAVATAPYARSLGLSTAVLEETHRILKERGDAFSLLVPAEPSLVDFYGNRGFRTMFLHEHTEFPVLQAELCTLEKTSLTACIDERAKFYAPFFYAAWDNDALILRDRDIAQSGGGVFCTPGVSGYLACVPSGDTLYIKEMTCPPSDALFAAAAQRFGCTRIALERSCGRGTPYAMAYLYRKLPAGLPPGSFSLVMD